MAVLIEEFAKDNALRDTAASIQSIGEFCKGVIWITQNPYECCKIIVLNTCGAVKIITLTVSATVLLMAIFGYKGGLKWIPITGSIYVILKLLSVAM